MTRFFEGRNTVNAKEIYYIGGKRIHYNCEFCFDTCLIDESVRKYCGCQRSFKSFSLSKIMKAIIGNLSSRQN